MYAYLSDEQLNWFREKLAEKRDENRPIYVFLHQGLIDTVAGTYEYQGWHGIDRAEEFAAEHRETFDLAVSRAVAALPVLCELCLPLVKPGGKFLAMKSVESDAELAASQHAIAILGGAVEAVRDYAIPGTDVRHRLIVVEKVKKTPEKYPRMFAKIKKNPL